MHSNANDGADFWKGAEIIHAYSRAQAIEDGILVDLRNQPDAELDELAREHGIRWPVAMTSAAFFEWLAPSERDAQDGQSIVGRLHDFYTLYKRAVKAAPAGADMLFFQMHVWKEGRQHVAQFKAMCGPGDDGTPVLTFMLPDED